MLGALVGGALSFLGGRSQRKQSQRQWEINRQDNLPQGIRANAEAAGFNPLVFAGPGVGNGAGYQPTMGHELSTAGQIVTDASLALENQKIRRAELELENKRLEELVKANTLRPTTPGVYGDRNATTGQRTEASRIDPITGDAGEVPGSVPVDSSDPRRDIRDRRNSVNQPISFLGMNIRPTGYTTSAQAVEDAAGDLGGSLWGIPTAIDYAAGTYLHNIGRPFGRFTEKVYNGFDPKPPSKRPKKANTKTKEYRDHMRSAYPTVYD